MLPDGNGMVNCVRQSAAGGEQHELGMCPMIYLILAAALHMVHFATDKDIRICIFAYSHWFSVIPTLAGGKLNLVTGNVASCI